MKRSPIYVWLSMLAFAAASIFSFSLNASASNVPQITAQGNITFPTSLLPSNSNVAEAPLSTSCPTSTTCFQLGVASTSFLGPTPNLKSGISSLLVPPTLPIIRPGKVNLPTTEFTYVEEIANGVPSNQWILSQLSSGPSGFIGSLFLGTGISCTTVSNCEVIGITENFSTSSSFTSTYLALSHFDGASFSVPATAGTPLPSSGQSLPHISCSNTGLCIGTALSDVVIVQNGAVTVDPLSNHITTGTNLIATQLSCSNAGLCGVVGTYKNSSGISASFVETYQNGVFKSDQLLGDSATSTNQELYVTGISCTDATNCEIVGESSGFAPILSAPPSGTTAFVAPVTNGVIGAQIPVTVPSGPTNYNSGDSISCGATGDCLVSGSYAPAGSTQSTNFERSYLATFQNGVQTSTTIPFDADTTASLPIAISCQGNLACTAVELSTLVTTPSFSVSLIPITNGVAGSPIAIETGITSSNAIFLSLLLASLNNPLACGPAANCELGYNTVSPDQKSILTSFVNFSPSTQGVALSPLGLINGYRIAGADGSVYDFGTSQYRGGANNLPLAAPIVSIINTPDDQGYWLIGADGGVFSYGDATYYGSAANLHLNKPIVGAAVTPDGRGYWLVAADGGVFSYGDATYYGSAANLNLNKPVVGIATTPDGRGYWLVAADGGVFSYGDATYYGSAANLNLNKPVVGIMTSPDGGGYFLVAGDGGVFAYGDSAFQGSTGGNPPMTTIEGISY